MNDTYRDIKEEEEEKVCSREKYLFNIRDIKMNKRDTCSWENGLEELTYNYHFSIWIQCL